MIVYLSLTGSQNKQSRLEMNREELNERMLQCLKDGVDLKAYPCEMNSQLEFPKIPNYANQPSSNKLGILENFWEWQIRSHSRLEILSFTILEA